MAILQKSRLVGLLFLFAALSACAGTVTRPDGAEMDADTYNAEKQREHKQAVATALNSSLDECNAQEMAKEEYNTCRWANMADRLVQRDMVNALTSTGYWQKSQSDRQFWLQIADLVVNNPFMQAFAFGQLGGGGGSGTEIQIGGKAVAKGDGGDGRGGTGTTASTTTNLEEVNFVTGKKSSFQSGDGVQVSGKDGQFQTGDGIQGQEGTSRPSSNQGGDDSDFASGGASATVGLP